MAGSSLIRLHRTALSKHGIQTWGSKLGAAVDDDAGGSLSDAAVERGEVETVEKAEGGED